MREIFAWFFLATFFGALAGFFGWVVVTIYNVLPG